MSVQKMRRALRMAGMTIGITVAWMLSLGLEQAIAQAPVPSPADLDQKHPERFVTITEETSAHHAYCLYLPDGNTRDLCKLDHSANNPAAEVDRRSRIHIYFDRQRLLNDRFANSDITVRAVLSKPDGSQPPVEVPGYSVVGEQARVAPVRLRLGREVLTGIAELSIHVVTPMKARLDSIARLTAVYQANIPPAEAPALRMLQARVGVLTDSSRRLAAMIEDSLRSYSQLGDALMALGASTDTSQGLKAIRGVTQAMADQLHEVSRLREIAVRAADSLAKAVEMAQTEKARAETRRVIALAWRRTVLDARPLLEHELTDITSDTVVFNAVVRRQFRDPGALQVRVRAILEDYLVELDATAGEDDNAVATIELDVQRIVANLEDLRSIATVLIGPGRTEFENDVVQTLLSQLKDTDILVPEIGAEPGDILKIIVSSGAGPQELPRELQVRLIVREFGLVHHISDSFLFLNRGRSVPGYVAGTTDTVAAAYNYIPTAGVTFGWTLEHRRNWGGNFFSTLVRWFHPGLGFNVSFPRFSNQVRQPATGGAGAVLTTDDGSSDRFDLAVGGVATLFNGALQFTYGRDLTADRDRSYWGIGFSFIRTLSEVKTRIGGIQ